MKYEEARLDHRVIADIIEEKSRVLDLGCGEGELMLLLTEEKKARVQGIELAEKAIYKCVEKGLSVFHGDIDSGLIEYPNKSFDYVILNQSMQEVKHAGFVLEEALRVGKKVVVGFPNFAYLPARSSLFFLGKTPITKSLPHRWYNTPNLHFLTISDFIVYCKENKITILKTHYFDSKKKVSFWPNLFAANALFVLAK